MVGFQGEVETKVWMAHIVPQGRPFAQGHGSEGHPGVQGLLRPLKTTATDNWGFHSVPNLHMSDVFPTSGQYYRAAADQVRTTLGGLVTKP